MAGGPHSLVPHTSLNHRSQWPSSRNHALTCPDRLSAWLPQARWSRWTARCCTGPLAGPHMVRQLLSSPHNSCTLPRSLA